MSADDYRLITHCLQGDTSALGELVLRYQDRLFNSVFRVLDNAEDAQDVVQDAFLNAYQNLDSFKGDALFFTWLYRIAFNTAISLRRKSGVLWSASTAGRTTKLPWNHSTIPSIVARDAASNRPKRRDGFSRRCNSFLRTPQRADPEGYGRTEVRNDGGHLAGAHRNHPKPFGIAVRAELRTLLQQDDEPSQPEE